MLMASNCFVRIRREGILPPSKAEMWVCRLWWKFIWCISKVQSTTPRSGLWTLSMPPMHDAAFRRWPTAVNLASALTNRKYPCHHISPGLHALVQFRFVQRNMLMLATRAWRCRPLRSQCFSPAVLCAGDHPSFPVLHLIPSSTADKCVTRELSHVLPSGLKGRH